MIVYEPTTEELISDLMTCYACKFSREAAKAMIEWIDEIYTGTEVFKWDPVAIGCDFSEWESVEDWGIGYFGGVMQMLEALGGCTLDECEEMLKEYIYFRGSLIQFDGGILVSSF
jgi:hypothetical protein